MELSEEVKKFLFPGDEEVVMFSHRTVSKEIADTIIKNGFKYFDSFQKTTDEIIDDIVYLTYWDTLRKQYGGHIVIIAINKKFLNELQKEIQPKYEAQQVLSTPIGDDEENNGDEMRYLLPRQFVKGHIDRETGEIIVNIDYDPSYVPIDLHERIKKLHET